MKRIFVLLLLIAFAMSLSASSFAQWTKIGDGANAIQYLSGLSDRSRSPNNDMVVDSSGRIFVTTNNCQFENDKGYVTIFTPSGSSYTRYDIDLQNCRKTDGSTTQTGQNVQGSITRLVLGKDADDNVCVYGVQNWVENQWNYNPGHNWRIIQIRPDPTSSGDWAVYVVKEYTGIVWNTANKIETIASHPAGGVVWTMNGADNAWKNQWAWKYDPESGNITRISTDNAPTSSWGIGHKVYGIEYVENNQWAVFYSYENSNNQYGLTAFKEATARAGAVNGTNPTTSTYFGIGRPSAPLGYDSVNKKLWYGGRGQGYGSPTVWHNMILTWTGDPANGGLFTPTFEDPKQGVVSQKGGHLFPKRTGDDYGGPIWVSALAANSNDGSGWYGVSGESTYTYSFPLDRVYVKFEIPYVNDMAINDAGIPQAGARILALNIKGDTAYALVADPTTGVYSVYKRSAIVSQYGNTASLADVKKGTKYFTYFMANPKVVTYTGYDDDLGQYADFTYVQDQNRVAGIKLAYSAGDYPGGLAVGDLVTFFGTLNVVDGEAMLVGIGQMNKSGTTVPKPLGMNVKAVGGNQFGAQPATNPAYGLTNVGLFVTVAGKVVSPDAANKKFFIDDGSGSNLEVQCVFSLPSAVVANNIIVSVRGVVGVKDASGARILWVESASDIKKQN
ncbi:MAG: hypothetical protein SNJ70_02480 [Armatimonadota bacterium]